MQQQPEVSRRRFLGMMGAAAGPMVVPASVFGATAPSERIGIGMIGMGRQARHANLPPFLHSPDTVVLAVCDVDAWRLDQARQLVEKHYASARASGKYRGCAACRDFRDVLARPDIDAVMISTPDHWHVPQAIAAVRAGKDISVEKPLTLSIAEGRALCDEVARYARVSRTDSEFRSHGYMRRACELVLNGRIGKLHTIRTGVPRGDRACGPQPVMPVPEELDYDLWLGPAPDAPYTRRRVHTPHSYARPGWMRVRDYCDGMICNWGTHLNDIAQWGLGMDDSGPVEIVPPEDPSEGRGVKFIYENGVEMIHGGRGGVTFFGTEGEIFVNRGQLESKPEDVIEEEIGDDEVRLYRSESGGHGGHRQDWIDCVRSRQ
ncbi:MAG: Gfo/Idh/MocA family protein, partial [Planctomycetota bacterium]